ncbi:tRNA pseudouridine(38,39,40) synthase TruA [Arachidicoccus ginsenosidimutans]|uniref:tRNA pseudouridine(38-40) synthase TruA n=1 Tax=Arachidicoccus sp. BS20 TaxID=1850526 RepID=UPI0007F17B07|nr:tRNA pseudouridine(38-40) synthase TruA [Arachidicoccus sp. BS20]ANI90479.1 tRNA pseudouridine(38,39,40) synthase TruA [Arachidicoccus sp. BS20]
MPRYFLELQYKGTAYKGFQSQPNMATIQGEVEKALQTFLQKSVSLTTSSRTDAGVHALQNFFHFDTDIVLSPKILYNLNAILPNDIVLKNLCEVGEDRHSRFDAASRVYQYYLYFEKNPFLADRAYFYPFKLDKDKLQQTADILKSYKDFTTFSKRNTQVHTFICDIKNSLWFEKDECLVYRVEANRFLRGMVRALVGTMLKVGRGSISLDEFKNIIESKNCTNADFSTPAHGLFLMEVKYPFELKGSGKINL